MNTIAHVSVVAILISAVTGLPFFENHRYGEAQMRPPQSRRGYSGLQNQIMKERQEQLIKFIGERLIRTDVTEMNSNDYRPKDVIRPEDVVGVLPSKVFKMSHKESFDHKKQPEATTPKPADADTGESQDVFTYNNLWSGSQFTPERIANHRYAESHRTLGLYEKPYGKVRVHTYRGPAKEYWVLPLHHHKPEQKTYTPWGYYVKQPVGSDKHKFHSPLDLSFHYD